MTATCSNSNMQQLAGVDVTKYVMAFCVVAIHFRSNYSVYWHYPKVFEWAIMLAVPFFFIASGYLLQRKFEGLQQKECASIARKRAWKICRLWLCWLLISLPLAIYAYRNITFSVALKEYTYGLVVNGWASCAAPMWYLYSLIWICLIVSISVRFRYYKPLLLSFFLVAMFLNWYAAVSQIHIFMAFKIYTGHILGGGAYIIAGMLLYNSRLQVGGGYFVDYHSFKLFNICLQPTIFSNNRWYRTIFNVTKVAN